MEHVPLPSSPLKVFVPQIVHCPVSDRVAPAAHVHVSPSVEGTSRYAPDGSVFIAQFPREAPSSQRSCPTQTVHVVAAVLRFVFLLPWQGVHESCVLLVASE